MTKLDQLYQTISESLLNSYNAVVNSTLVKHTIEYMQNNPDNLTTLAMGFCFMLLPLALDFLGSLAD